MGNGVPNQGPWQHRSPGVINGYQFVYHDQQVTGTDPKFSPEITVSAYQSLRSAAAQGQTAFNTAVAASGWGTFFSTYTGIDMTEARLGVLDLG